jgi:hypothetical protein
MFRKSKKLLISWMAQYKHVISSITFMFDFRALLQQAEIGRSRSSVINPLQWAVVIILAGMLGILLGHAPSWLLIFFSCLLGLLVVLLALAYVYFGITNPDALRSEKYVLVKAAIEKQYAGDSLTGLHEVISQFDSPGQKLLPDPNAERIDSGR